MTEPTIIEFTVSGRGITTKTYQAEEGMTWSEFIESSYNNGSFSLGGSSDGTTFVSNGKVLYGHLSFTYSGTEVQTTDTIIGGATYTGTNSDGSSI